MPGYGNDSCSFCSGQELLAHNFNGWYTSGMTAQRTYVGPTTPQQRHLLFTTWQQTGSVTTACVVARVGRRTFYSWKPRFVAHGFAGLEQPPSSAPHQPQPTDPAIREQVLALRQTHRTWGKRRMAAERAKHASWHV